MKRMLVNATQQEELRVAIVEGQKLFRQHRRNVDVDRESVAQQSAVFAARDLRHHAPVESEIQPRPQGVFRDLRCQCRKERR